MSDIGGEAEIVIYSDTINKYESLLNERNLILVDAEIKNETNQGFRIIGRRIRSLNQFISDNKCDVLIYSKTNDFLDKIVPLLNHLEIKNIYEYLGDNVLVGFRKGKTLHSDSKYTLKECQEQHGLNTDKVWYDSFEGLDNMTENYIRNMRANGEMINKNPRIKMSTIHGAKGGEADKVLLMQDITNAALETFSHDPDELHRLFYTGATRAKRELHVLDPKDFDRAYIL